MRMPSIRHSSICVTNVRGMAAGANALCHMIYQAGGRCAPPDPPAFMRMLGTAAVDHTINDHSDMVWMHMQARVRARSRPSAVLCLLQMAAMARQLWRVGHGGRGVVGVQHAP
jgi:hypothetical protein